MHIGTNIKRIRELRGMKQEAMAIELGISHQAVSKMEQGEELEEDKLTRVAEILGVTTDTIRNFNENAALGASNFFSPQFNDNSTAVYNNFNPVEKFAELIEEYKQLYERMLETERNRVKLLEDLLKANSRNDTGK